MYSAQSINFNNESVNSKGVLTTSNFSNSEYNQTNTKPTNVFKWFDGKNSSKSKRTNEGYLKATAASEATNYSSNRPKSAKGAGMYINTSKYRNSEGYTSNKYKNSINKGSVGSKNALKKSGNTSQLKKNQSVKIITAKTSKELGSSYNKTNNASVTKYVKTARGSKKLESSNSKILDYSNNLTNISSKISPSGYTPRSGLNHNNNDPINKQNSSNTKSYNTLMTYMQNKEQEYTSVAGGVYPGGGMKSISSTSKLINSPQIKCIELDSSVKIVSDPKIFKQTDVQVGFHNKIVKQDLEEYLRTKKASRNLYSSESSSATQSQTFKQAYPERIHKAEKERKT